MTIQEIIKYLSETPGNTNPAVISTMVEEYASGGGGDVTVVNFSGNPSDGFTADVPYDELIDAEDIFALYDDAYVACGYFGDDVITFKFYDNSFILDLYYSSDDSIDYWVEQVRISFTYNNGQYVMNSNFSLDDIFKADAIIGRLQDDTTYGGLSYPRGSSSGMEFYFMEKTESEPTQMLKITLSSDGSTTYDYKTISDGGGE